MSDPISPPKPATGNRPSLAEFGILVACAALLAGFSLIDADVHYPSPPDFGGMEVDEKKLQFFSYLSPMISEINFDFAADRRRVQSLSDRVGRGERLGWSDSRWLGRLALRLEVDLESMELADALEVFKRRAGVVPESLVLVQAAVESGWGTSRFAIEGNNFFGQRCYRRDCGIVPERQREGEQFGLARFSSPAASVEGYILNLNTHESYREFRDLRERRRNAGEPITGLALVEGLGSYSERGADYIEQIVSMIRSNNLE